MADIEDLSPADMAVADRMASLPASVLGLDPDEDELAQGDPKAGQEHSDDPDAPDEIRDEPEDEGEDGSEGTDAKEPLAAAEAADQEFEIEDPNGGSRTVKLSELIQSDREYAAFKHERSTILSRIEDEAQTHAKGVIQQARSYLDNVGVQLAGVLEVIQAPAGPSEEMLDPSSPHYDPDRYHLEFARHQRVMGQFNKVQQTAKAIKAEQERLEQEASKERVNREYRALVRAWPEWGDAEKAKALYADMTSKVEKYYGKDVLAKMSTLSDHEYFLIARDALAYRAMKDKGGDVKAKVVAKAATVKAKQSDAAPQKRLTSEDATHMRHRQLLKQTGNIRNAAKAFEKFV